ncbi:MAG: hypothetical protein K0R25_1106 [Rickettsiaceae bacterium]|jgi:hypothetical protein|nr:hypothetical protein [Rickettsiaceae bacterium]
MIINLLNQRQDLIFLKSVFSFATYLFRVSILPFLVTLSGENFFITLVIFNFYYVSNNSWAERAQNFETKEGGSQR